MNAKLHTSLIKQQFFITHTINQTEIPASLDSWCQKCIFIQNAVSTKKKIASPYNSTET